MNNYVRCAFREFRHRKGRTVANIAGYAVATSVVVSLFVWLDFSRFSTDAILKDVGAHFIGYMPSGASPEAPVAKDPTEGFVSAGARSTLFSAALIEKIRQLPSVLDASPYLSFRIRSEKDSHVFIIGGFDPSSHVSIGTTTCAPSDIIHGRFLVSEDRGKVMLEGNYAFTQTLGVGSRITIGHDELEVIGIINPALRPAKADVYLHIEDARKIIQQRVRPGSFPEDSVNQVLVEAKGSRTMAMAITGLGSISPAFKAFGFACWQPAATALGMGEKAVGFLLTVILVGLFLFVGKTQFASIVERDHDFGILKVVGWSKHNIMLQIIIESLLLSITGCLIGSIIAGLVVYLVPLQAVTGFPVLTGVVISPFLLLRIFLLAMSGGVLVSIFPALAAARRDPAESLRRL